MPQTTTQGDVSARKGCSAETSDEEFEKMMLFAFRRGVELLGAPESGPAQIQGNPMENYGKSVSQHMEAAGGVPKNVTQLKPAIDNLLYKDLPKEADQQWLTKAKKYLQLVREQVSKEEDFFKSVLTDLEETAALYSKGEASNEGLD